MRAAAIPDSKLDAKVVYNAADSMIFDLDKQKLYLYGTADVQYDKITLKADYIELDLKNDLLLAHGRPDSTGKIIGKPLFDDGGQKFNSDTMRYNFQSKKGKISTAMVQEGDGYIHGEQVKKLPNDVIYIKGGKYTTCNNPDPHFHIEATKLKIIPDDKIITGPAYLKVADIPTPLAVPFGYFPNQKGQSSGIVVPSYGESPGLGFYLQNGGYYFGFSDYFDLAILGDIYSRGSWGLGAISNYKKRYKFSGKVDVSYSKLLQGFSESPDFSKKNNFFVRWRHDQDPKARPNSRFSANVNAGTTDNFTNNFNSSLNDYVTNTFKSNISYSTSFFKRKLNLTLNGSHAQNTQDSSVSVTLPDVTLASQRFYLGDILNRPGKWYSKVSISYTGQARNRVKVRDTLLFTPTALQKLQNGIQHSIPLRTSVKMLKWFTLTPGASYTEKWHLQRLTQTWNPADSSVVSDTASGFWATREYGINATLSTKLYAFYEPAFGLKKVIPAIRHVMTPSATINIKPDFSDPKFNYWSTVQTNVDGDSTWYSYYSLNEYGAPSRGESGVARFSLLNNIEMKVRDRSDTTGTGTRKIKLLENLGISSQYNMFADSLNWSDIKFDARTTILKNVNLRASATTDPYAINADGNNINESEWSRHRRIGRMVAASTGVTFSLRSKNRKQPSSEEQEALDENLTPEEVEEIRANPEQFVDFNVPWALNVTYNLAYSQPGFKDSRSVTNTIGFTGDMNVTEKWKVGFRTGWDFQAKEMTLTSIDIFRDLHCWEMSFNVVPFGLRRSYTFDIRVKSSILQDLKLSRRRSWYDF